MSNFQVNPDGSFFKAPGARGLLMGNRGIINDHKLENAQPFASKAWLACVMTDSKGVALPSVPVKYTKLFFLDELTALSAGHRPCWQCQRARHKEFVDTWIAVHGAISEISEVDKALHAERIGANGSGLKPVVESVLRDLPAGTMVRPSRDSRPHLWFAKRLFPWALTGYQPSVSSDTLDPVQVLTPPAIVKLLSAGLSLSIDSNTAIHPSLKGTL